MTDHYLSDDRCAQRLLKEYKEHGQLIIAVDYDGTVFNYHGINDGQEFVDVPELIREAKAANCKIIIFSVSSPKRYPEMRKFLRGANIPFDTINSNIVHLHAPGKPRKVYYNILLDDRAGLSASYNILKKVLNIVNKD